VYDFAHSRDDEAWSVIQRHDRWSLVLSHLPKRAARYFERSYRAMVSDGRIRSFGEASDQLPANDVIPECVSALEFLIDEPIGAVASPATARGTMPPIDPSAYAVVTAEAVRASQAAEPSWAVLRDKRLAVITTTLEQVIPELMPL
jgi:hypothetical protein